MIYADLTKEQQNAWSGYMEKLKLDPTIDRTFDTRYMVHTVDEYTDLFRAEHPAETKPSIVDTKELDEIQPEQLYQALMDHVYGISPIKNALIRDNISRKWGPFFFTLRAARDYVATAEDPLIIANAQTITNYGMVVLKDGGYIKISASCSFTCQSLLKTGSNQTDVGSSYDLYIIGKPGASGDNGDNGHSGGNGKKGSNGAANCFSSNRPGGKGSSGKDGTPGFQGAGGFIGENAPLVRINITELASTISVLNEGGPGGHGGRGGNGGNGGTGGEGGNGYNNDGGCSTHGGDGGNGGNGKNGGDGFNGGNGGDGSNISTIDYGTKNGSSVLVTNGRAPGGKAGHGGGAGRAGSGGEGQMGGSAGNSGASGSTGEPGSDGERGAIGFIMVKKT